MAIRSIDRVAVAAFAPASAEFIAAGTASGSVDISADNSNSVGIYKLGFGDIELKEPPLVGLCDSSEPFNRLSWGGATDEFALGLLAGGLSDGCIEIYNPATLLSDHENQETSIALTTLKNEDTLSVSGLEFNPLSPKELASSSNGIVCIWDTSTAALSTSFKATTTTSLAWNRKLPYILATPSEEGITAVWDLRKNKSVISFQDSRGKKKCSALQWHPDLNTQLMVAVDDATSPLIQVWDLRNNYAPIRELIGHTQGPVSLAWCPHDSSLALSCGRDRRTLCWDVSSGEVISEIPRTTEESMNFDVHWSGKVPGVFATSSYGGKLEIHNIEACSRSSHSDGQVNYKAPKWTKRPVSASFGFGGKIAVIKSAPTNSEVALHYLTKEDDLTEPSSTFEAAIGERDKKTSMKGFCEQKFNEATSDKEREIWKYLTIMLEGDAGRKLLLKELGFSPPLETEASDTPRDKTEDTSLFADDGDENFFDKIVAKESSLVEKEGLEEDHVVEEEILDFNREMEEDLVAGNFKAAVERCVKLNKMAEALVIAFAGGQELFQTTRDQYLKRTSSPYLKIISAVVNHDLKGQVMNRPISAWKNTLGFICTFASSSEEYASLADTLALKLEQVGDAQAATLCYICAGNVEKTVEVLSRSLRNANHGKHFAIDLQGLVEKSVALNIAADKQRVGPALTKLMEKYVELLACQGLLQSAAAYLSLVPVESSPLLVILQDRIQKSTQVTQVRSHAYVSGPVQPAVTHQRPIVQGRVAREPSYPFQQPAQAGYRSADTFQQPNTPGGYPPSYLPQARPAIESFPPAPFGYRPAGSESNIAQKFTPLPFTHTVPNQPVRSAVDSRAHQNPLQSMNQPRPAGAGAPHASQPNIPGFQSRPAPDVRAAQYSPQPLSAHLTNPVENVAPPAPPAPPPTVQTADTSKVPVELKPTVEALTRLFNETSQALSSVPGKSREIDDNSKKLGNLFAKLNANDISPDAASMLAQLCQALNAQDFVQAISIQVSMTTTHWDECSFWITALKRMIRTRQSMR